MKRYFFERAYRRYYGLIRCSYRLGGINLAIRVNNSLYERHPQHREYISAAWISFCSVLNNGGYRLVK